MKPSFRAEYAKNKYADKTEYVKDLEHLAIKARRFWYANRCLPNDEIRKTRRELEDASMMFGAKYKMTQQRAMNLGFTIAYEYDLGLAY